MHNVITLSFLLVTTLSNIFNCWAVCNARRRLGTVWAEQKELSREQWWPGGLGLFGPCESCELCPALALSKFYPSFCGRESSRLKHRCIPWSTWLWPLPGCCGKKYSPAAPDEDRLDSLWRIQCALAGCHWREHVGTFGCGIFGVCQSSQIWILEARSWCAWRAQKAPRESRDVERLTESSLISATKAAWSGVKMPSLTPNLTRRCVFQTLWMPPPVPRWNSWEVQNEHTFIFHGTYHLWLWRSSDILGSTSWLSRTEQNFWPSWAVCVGHRPWPCLHWILCKDYGQGKVWQGSCWILLNAVDVSFQAFWEQPGPCHDWTHFWVILQHGMERSPWLLPLVCQGCTSGSHLR